MAMTEARLPGVWQDFLRSQRPVIIYGAGRQATVVYDFCKMYRKKCACLVTTSSRERWGMLPPESVLPLYLLAEIPSGWDKADYDVVIALAPKYQQEVQEMLVQHGWKHIVTVSDWDLVNAGTRDVFFQNYLREHGAEFPIDGQGRTYLSCVNAQGRHFTIYYDLDEIYKTTLLGDINNILLPSLFDDYSLTGEYGPCEYGEARIEHGDIVFDLGACIGAFTCVAASKAEHVYAFEPTVSTFENYLLKNAAFYDNVTCKCLGVFDCCKTIPFYENTNFSESLNITRNSIHKHFEPSYTETSIQVVNLDDYVARNSIARVDFIKSHTEYCELEMLLGAQEILKQFAPKMALWGSVKAEEIVQTIHRINPSYIVDRSWNKKLFAWVPKEKA